MNEIFFRTGIGKFIRDTWLRRQSRRLHNHKLRQVTELVVQVADPLIRNADDYQKILQDPIDEATKYFTQLIDAIPGPVDLSRKGYESDHTVKFLFASPEELEEVVRISPELRYLRDKGYTGEVVALLTMTLRERTVYGYVQDGETFQRDVAQQAVDFVDHRIVAPETTMDSVKNQLVEKGLSILATTAMEIITGLKAKKAELREQKEYLGAMLRIMGGRKIAWESFTPLDPAQLEEITKAEQRLVEVKAELAELQNQLDGPEDALNFLKTVVSRPSEELLIQEYPLHLNWKRIRVSGKDETEGNEISLAELSNRSGAIKRSAVLVTLVLGEAAMS